MKTNCRFEFFQKLLIFIISHINYEILYNPKVLKEKKKLTQVIPGAFDWMGSPDKDLWLGFPLLLDSFLLFCDEKQGKQLILCDRYQLRMTVNTNKLTMNKVVINVVRDNVCKMVRGAFKRLKGS